MECEKWSKLKTSVAAVSLAGTSCAVFTMKWGETARETKESVDQLRHPVKIPEFPYSGIDWRARCDGRCSRWSSQALRKQEAVACCNRLGHGTRAALSFRLLTRASALIPAYNVCSSTAASEDLYPNARSKHPSTQE